MSLDSKSRMNSVPDCEFVRAHIELLGNDAYGGVVSGTLILRSKVIEVIVEDVTQWRLGVCASCECVRGWAQLDEKMSLSDARFLAVPVLNDVSLLVTKKSGSNVYRRVGLWRIPSDPFDDSDLFGNLDISNCSAEYLRWRDQILPTIPVTEIMIE
jgi:hypothetical protein